MTLDIGAADPTDYDDLVALTCLEGWNYTRDDFDALGRMRCARILVASEDRRVIGTLTLFDYGECGWISNVLVRRERRGEGIAGMLIARAVSLLEGKRTIALFAYQDRVGVYAKAGFRLDRQFAIVRLRGGGGGAGQAGIIGPEKGRATASALNGKGTSAWSRILGEITEMDRRCFGYCRPEVLGALLERGRVVYPAEGGGFAILRPDPVEPVAGPVVSGDRAAGASVLLSALGELGPRATAVVPLPCQEGTEEVFRVSRLYLGERPGPEPEAIAYAGLEFG